MHYYDVAWILEIKKHTTMPNSFDSTRSWLTTAELDGLAPLEIKSHRTDRFRGEENPASLVDLQPEDRVLLPTIYQSLLKIFHALRPVYSDPASCLIELHKLLKDNPSGDLLLSVQALGRATIRINPEPNLMRLFHDLRGGALHALLIRLQFVEESDALPEEALQIFFLARDHLKIMRNCILDLDIELRRADTTNQDHHLALLAEKWTKHSSSGGKTDVPVEVFCHYSGVICESCLEFSTLDRIIYNLMNNAARFARADGIQFMMSPVPMSYPQHIRFVVANRISPEHHQLLRDRFGENFSELLRGGYTTGGQGLGLRICADFCAQAYGVTDHDAALAQGLFGVHLVQDVFCVWFHWPLRGE
jgi:signal transduction histidine kinase